MNESRLSKIYSADEIISRLMDNRRDLIVICHDYVASLKARPELRNELLSKGASAHELNSMERCGNGLDDPRLALKAGMPARKLRLCTLSEQVVALNNGIEVYDPAITDVRVVQLDELSPKQTAQVFSCDHIRTIAEQRTWISEHQPQAAASVADRDYKVTRKGIEVRCFCGCGCWRRLSKALVKQLLKEMGE